MGVGTTNITASQAGNAYVNAATDAVQSLNVIKADQSIDFAAPAAKTPGDADFDPGATASSGLTLTYSTSDTTVATIVSGKVHIVGAGTTNVTASQAGDANYNSTPDAIRSFTVNKHSQTLAFATLANKTFGDADYAPGATATSALAVSYASSNTAVVAIVGGKIHIVGAGTANITASQAGDATYNAAADSVLGLTVNKAAQTLAFPTLTAKTVGDSDYASGATATSSLAVSYASSNTAVATIVSGKIHIVGAGTANITASQAGNANYTAAADSALSLTVNKKSQTITFTTLADKSFGAADFAVSAASSSGLAVTFASSTPSVVTVSGGTVTVVGPGTATITASQAGDASYNPATDVVQSFTVNKANQSLTFAALTNKTFGDVDYAPGATATSSLAVTYASSNTAVATIVSDQIHIIGVGTTNVTASQAGNADYNAATDAVQSLTVNKAAQSITFTTLSAKTFGDADFAPGATATSSLAVTYVSSNTAVVTIVSNQIHLVGVGTTTITASQAGNATYNAATDATQSLTVNKASQTITFSTLSAKTFGDADYAPGASATSSLAVTYASSNTAVATIVSGQIHIVGAGTATITASQAGNATYNAATDATQSLTVNRASQSIAFSALTTKTFGDADYVPGATATSGLAATYASSNTAVAAIVSGQIHIVGAGSTNITASQAGNSDYNAATDAIQGLTVNKATQSITFATLSGKSFGDAAYSPGATASSGLTVTYASSNTAVAAIVSGQIHIIGSGAANITASQAGNSNYNPATDAVRSLSVGKLIQSLTFPALTAKTFGDADYAPGATATSSLTATYASSNAAVATIVSGKIHITGSGTTNVTASQTGDSAYGAATDAIQNLTVNKAAQTLTFAALTSKTMGDADFAPGATASSGLTVTYASFNAAVATIVSGRIHITGSGSTEITASQAGNSNYSAAANVTNSLTVGKINQALTFAPLAAKIFGDADFAPGAAAPSSLPILYASSNTAVATIVSGKIHIVGVGTTKVTASQAGDSAYSAAADAVQNLTVAKAPQSLAFAALPAKTFGDADFPPGATASSSLLPAYASSDSAVAAIVNGKIHLVGSGSTIITASQAGDSDYSAATDVPQSLAVSKAAHSLAFQLGADTLKTEGDAAFGLTAISSVGLPVAFSSSDTAVAKVNGDSVWIGHAGTADVTAGQDGNAQFAAAAPVTLRLRVRPAIPTAFTPEEMMPRTGGIIDTSVGLSWIDKAKATGYHLQVAQAMADPAGAKPLLDTVVSDTSFTLRGLAFGTRINWRAAPLNATGQAAYSSYASLQVRPTPPLPIDLSRIPVQARDGTGTTVELVWPAAANSTGYHIQVSLDTAKTPLIDTVVAKPSLTLSDLGAGSEQHWRVTPVNGISEAPFTPWLTFKVQEKDAGSVTRGAVVDSIRPVQVSDLIGVTSKDSTLGGMTFTVTQAKEAPINLPAGFMPLTGGINLNARIGTAQVNDTQLTITLTPPDTALNGTRIDGANQPMVYTIDSATGEMQVVYDLARDSAGRIVLPLSKGKSFLLAVDTVPPVVKDGTPPAVRQPGSSPVISGVVEDNIRNCRTMLHYRKGGSETFDSIPLAIDSSGHFELPLDLVLDSSGFEYNLTATDGRNIKATPHTDVPVQVRTMKSADSLPSMQWRLFALPTLPNETRWTDLASALGKYGEDWKLFARTATGLVEFGADLQHAEAGAAYWLKSRRQGFLPSISGGVATPVNRPFEVILPPKSWRSFGNPFLFPVAWQSIVDSSHAASGALMGPYTYRDTAWLAPLEIPALIPWEGYYAYNASNDTLRLRIPALKAKSAAPIMAQTAFNLQWEIRGADGKDGGNFFGALPGTSIAQASTNPGATLAKSSASGPAIKKDVHALATAQTSLWQAAKPENPDGGIRAGFLSDGSGAGLLQTDFRALTPQGGLTWSARLSGLKPGQNYTSRFQGFAALPKGTAVALADPATGNFVEWSADQTYVVEAQAGEESRDLQFFVGSPEYVQSQGASFRVEYPFTIELKNYPNPARGFTVVHFAVPASASGSRMVDLSIYDMQGRLVRVLTSGPTPSGWHSIHWDARDQKGHAVAAGVYRILLHAGDKKMNRSLQILP